MYSFIPPTNVHVYSTPYLSCTCPHLTMEARHVRGVPGKFNGLPFKFSSRVLHRFWCVLYAKKRNIHLHLAIEECILPFIFIRRLIGSFQSILIKRKCVQIKNALKSCFFINIKEQVEILDSRAQPSHSSLLFLPSRTVLLLLIVRSRNFSVVEAIIPPILATFKH